jgi:hypothetical protein
MEWRESGLGEFFWKRTKKPEARWCFREKRTKMRIQAFNLGQRQKTEIL